MLFQYGIDRYITNIFVKGLIPMIIKRLSKRIKLFISNKLFIIKIRYRFRAVPEIHSTVYIDVIIRGANKKDIDKIVELYQKRTGKVLSARHKYFLKKCEGKLCIIAEKDTHIVGVDLFYINPRDFKQKTVHEGFVGVLPDYERKGIATSMRKHAIEHFKKAGFNGISTRISLTNIGSLKSAEKLGFKPIEKYSDSEMNEERYYMICNFCCEQEKK
jgi:L-amino acid N-acyltransferase YncA